MANLTGRLGVGTRRRAYHELMQYAPALAPGIPTDYYRSIFDAEQHHWWFAGMRELTAALLGDRMLKPGSRLLDAGCGTGGFLRWVLDRGAFADTAGVDIAGSALELARERVPEARLEAARLAALPFDSDSFDVVVSHDVLQHVPEGDVLESLLELYRLITPGGTLLLRTNGARKLRREREDWRAYDRETIRKELAAAGFDEERVTYANTVLSIRDALRRRFPHAPSDEGHGIPCNAPRALVSTIGRRILAAEARYLAQPGRTLPYGHSIFAVATRPA